MAHSVDEMETLGGSLADIRAFCRIVELGSLSAAARVLGETKGGVSRRISRLESHLQLQLLARHPRSVSVTTEGQLFYTKAREGLLLLEEGAELARSTRSEPRGTLRITAPLDLALEWLPRQLVAFAERYPQIRVELLTSDQRLDLASHQIDIALRATSGDLPDMGYTARRLCTLPMGWYATPEYLAEHAAPCAPEELHRHALILTNYESEQSLTLKQGSIQEQLTLQPRFRCGDYATALRLTLSHGGIGFFPGLVAADAVTTNRLLPLLEQWQAPEGALFLITLNAPRAPARVQAFKQFLQEQIETQIKQNRD